MSNFNFLYTDPEMSVNAYGTCSTSVLDVLYRESYRCSMHIGVHASLY